MRRRIHLAWIVVMGLVSGPTGTVYGWTEGRSPRPTSLPVVYHLNESLAGTETGGPGADVAEQALRRAIEAWSAAGSRWHGELGPRVSGEDPNRTVVGWYTETPDGSGRWTWRPGIIAATWPGRGDSGITFSIALNAKHYEWVGNEIRERATGRLVDTLQSNLMFMIGLGLGLGISDVPESLMRYDARYESPQPDDIAGIRALYPPPPCGDGIAEHPEQCDDGNQTDGDGCTADCRREAPPELPDAGAPTDGGPNTIDDAGGSELADGSSPPIPDGSFANSEDGGAGPSVGTPGPGPPLGPPRRLEVRRVDGGCAVRTVGHGNSSRLSWALLCALGLLALASVVRRGR